MDPERVARLHARANGWAPRLSALSLLAARRGVVFFHETWGRTRPEPDAPALTKDAIFPLLSVTKPFTATAVMMLAEDGLLDVNRPVQFYIPEFRGEGKLAVNLHHLLTHTSGLEFGAIEVNRFLVPVPGDGDCGPDEHPAARRLVALACAAPLSFVPGSQHLYCDAGYALLLEIVRRVSGQAPADFMRDRIFAPLGMDRTGFGPVTGSDDDRVFWPESSPGARPLGGPDRPLRIALNQTELVGAPLGNLGLFSTGLDLAAFGQMYLNGGRYWDSRLLASGTISLMTRNHTPGLKGKVVMLTAAEASVGYGWFIQDVSKFPFLGPALGTPGSYSHSGWGGAFLWIDPVRELVIVVLSTQHEFWQPMGFYPWEADLFVNMVTSSVADE
jgi:CubicO group peptidase (beta-lactamase class C family)